MTANGGTSTLIGGSGVNVITLGIADSYVAGSYSVYGGTGPNTITAYGGSGTIAGGINQNNYIFHDGGKYTVAGGPGVNGLTVYADNSGDRINLSQSGSTVTTGEGTGGTGNEVSLTAANVTGVVAYGSTAGNNVLDASQMGQGVSLTGAGPNNTLIGGDGNDVLIAGAGGSQTLRGGAGNNQLTINAATGNNAILDGTGGTSTLVYQAAPGDNLVVLDTAIYNAANNTIQTFTPVNLASVQIAYTGTNITARPANQNDLLDLPGHYVDEGTYGVNGSTFGTNDFGFNVAPDQTVTINCQSVIWVEQMIGLYEGGTRLCYWDSKDGVHYLSSSPNFSISVSGSTLQVVNVAGVTRSLFVAGFGQGNWSTFLNIRDGGNNGSGAEHLLWYDGFGTLYCGAWVQFSWIPNLVWVPPVYGPLAPYDVPTRPVTVGVPTLANAPANVGVQATSAAGAVVTYAMPLAHDGSTTDPVVTASIPSGAVFPVGPTTVNFAASEASGAIATASFNVTVRATVQNPIPLTGTWVVRSDAGWASVSTLSGNLVITNDQGQSSVAEWLTPMSFWAFGRTAQVVEDAAGLHIDWANDTWDLEFSGVTDSKTIAALNKVGGLNVGQTANVLESLLQGNLSSGSPITAQVNTYTNAIEVIDAVNQLPAYSSTPVMVTLNLAAGSPYGDITASPPPGVTLVINGLPGGTETIVGHSPALTVSSGNVIVTGMTITTATNAPTIFVLGGILTLRNDIVQESTGYADAAIALTGGVLDLGTATNPGGNVLGVNGTGSWFHNATPNSIVAVGDIFEVDGTAVSVVTWTGGAGTGEWDDPNNWQDAAGNKRLPGSSDVALINQSGAALTHNESVNDSVSAVQSDAALALSSGSLSVATASTLNSALTLSGGTLTGGGSLTVNGAFTWTDGTLSGPAGSSLTAEGGMTVSSGTLDTRSLVNDGTAVLNTYPDALLLEDGAQVINSVNATFDLRSVANGGTAIRPGNNSQTCAFRNDGTLSSEAAYGNAIGVAMHNAGTIAAHTGELGLTNITSSGVITGDPGTLLLFNGGATPGDFTPASTTAADQVLFSGGAFFVEGGYGANSTATQSGTVAFDGPTTQVGSVTVNNGTADFSPASGPTTLTLTSLTLNNGNLTGSEDFVVTGAFTWNDGTLSGPAGSSLTAAGGLTIGGGGGTLDTRSLVNDGAALLGTTLLVQGSSQIINRPTAIFDLQSADSPYGFAAIQVGSNSAAAEFSNAGTLTSEGAIGIGIAMSNSGTVEVNTGSLQLGLVGGGSVNNNGLMKAGQGTALVLSGLTGTETGQFVGQTGTTLEFMGSKTFTSTSSISGDQVIFDLSYGPMDVNGSYSAHSTTVRNGPSTLTFGATATVTLPPDGTFTAGGDTSFDGLLHEQIEGQTPGAGFAQITASAGSVSLNGAFQVSLLDGFTPQPGASFVVVNIQGTGTASGIFAGLPEGAEFQSQFGMWRIDYQGGAGNGLVLTYLDTVPNGVALSLSTTSINEGDTLTLSGSLTDPDPDQTHTATIAWGDGSPSTTLNLAAGVLSFSGVSHQYLDNPAGQPDGTFTVTVTVTDQDGASGTAAAAVQVNNVPPTVHLASPVVSNPAGGPTTVGFTVSATDPSPVDMALGFTYRIDWGDGTIQTPDVQIISPTGNNGSGVALSHAYAAAGAYTVSVTASDKDGGLSQPVTALVLVSTAGGDRIVLNDPQLAAGMAPGAVWVTWGGTTTTYQPTDQVVVSGSGGSDVYVVNFGQLPVPLTVAGGGLTSGDKLTTNGVPNATTNDITKTAGAAAGQGAIAWTDDNPGTVTEAVNFSGVPHVTINAGGTKRNYVNDPGSDVTINGGPGDNTIEITATGGDGVVINGGPTTNSYVIDLGGLAGPVTINNSNLSATDGLVINGVPGDNTIAVSGSQVTAGAQTINLSAPLANATINGGSGNNQLTVANLTIPIQSLTLNSPGANNTITLVNAGSNVGSLSITGGSAGSNQVQVQGPLPANVQGQHLPPLVTAGPGTILLAGATFIGSGSFTDPNGGASYSATVDYGDGTGPQPLPLNADHSFSLVHTYSGSGTFTVTVSVNDGQNGTGISTFPVIVLPPASLSGLVWEDFNDDGQVDFGENGIAGVTITLTGTDSRGQAVHLTQTTDRDGGYVFLNLWPGRYLVTETQPANYLQGIDSVGTAGGNLSALDQFFVELAEGVDGFNYNFGERPSSTGPVQRGQTAGIGFWNNKNGQALILAFNGGGTSHELGDWLAATLPNIFGSNSSNDLAGKNNAYVAALFEQDFLLHGVKLDAQLLATALSVYATNATLDSTQAAANYGFTVSGYGVGTATFSVGSNGNAFGVANNITMTVLDLLLAADAQAVDGVLYNGNATKRTEANNVFSALNEAGTIS